MREDDYREIQLLKKYYLIDEEKKMITLPLHFDKASDIIDLNFVSTGNIVIKEEILVTIGDKIKSFPSMLKVKLDLIIDDYEDYDAKKILNSLSDCLEMNSYTRTRETKYNKVIAIVFFIVGLIILAFNVTANNYELYGTGQNVIYELLDIVAWVFVWQATTVAFLTKSEIPLDSDAFKQNVSNIILYNKNNDVLATLDSSKEFEAWELGKKHNRLKLSTLLVAGGLMIADSILTIPEIIDIFISLPQIMEGDKEILGVYIIIASASIIATIIEILVGICALAIYLGRGKIRKLRYVFLALMFLVLALNIFAIVTTPITLKTIFTTITTFVAEIAFIIGTIYSTYLERKGKKLASEEE